MDKSNEVSPYPAPPPYPVQQGLPASASYQAQPMPAQGNPVGQPGEPVAYVSTTTTKATRRADKLPGREYFPKFFLCLSITFLVLNCIVPGIGTLLASVLLFLPEPICKVDGGYGRRCLMFAVHFFSALGQIVAIAIGFGWVWAIIWATMFIMVSVEGNMANEGVVSEQVVVTQTVPSEQPPAYNEHTTTSKV